MNPVAKQPRGTQERPLEELAKVAVIGAVGVALLAYAFVAMWHATSW